LSPAAAVITAGAVVAALGVLLAAVRKVVRVLVDVAGVARALLQLQPRVVELGERLVVLVDEHDDHERRLLRLEVAVSRSEGLPHVP
jgi:hypothetical protein